MFELDHLRSFVTVAEEMHFGRAAARLNITQSPLSRQIQALERDLEAQLLDRTTRAVRLTSAGRTFLAEAHRVLAAAENATFVTRRAARGESGLIRLGFTAASVYRTLPLIVSHLRSILPNVDLVLDEMVSQEQIQALDCNRIDLALLRPSPGLANEESGIASSRFTRERLLLALPRGHVRASGRAPRIGDLDGEPFITFSPEGGRYFSDLLDTLFDESGVRPRVVQRVNQAHTMLALVGAGLGSALVPEAARDLRTGGAVLRPIRLPPSARPELLLAWRMDDNNPCLPVVRSLILGLAEPSGPT